MSVIASATVLRARPRSAALLTKAPFLRDLRDVAAARMKRSSLRCSTFRTVTSR